MRRALVLASLVVAIWPATPTFASEPAPFPNGVSSGDVTDHSIVLWARAGEEGDVRFRVVRFPFIFHTVFDDTVHVDVPEVPAKVEVDGLRSQSRYLYFVSDDDGHFRIGTFETLAQSGQRIRGKLRFGITGDWRGELSPYPAIANARHKRLDFFVKLGDTIYADFPSPAVPAPQAKTLAEYRAKHNEVYSSRFGSNTWASLQALVPIFATIDDHEVTNDFAGGAPASTDPRFPEVTGLINETELYRNGLQAFTEYNAIAAETWPVTGDPLFDGRPDLYRMRRHGSLAQLIMLDARSFRDTELPGVTNPLDPVQIGAFVLQSFDINPFTLQLLPPRTMLGGQQLARLKADLLDAQQDGVVWKFVMVNEPIQNLGVLAASDRFEGYSRERSEILQFIDDNAIDNVVFVTADIHGTLINNLTYQTQQDVIAATIQFGNPLAAPQNETSSFEISTGSVAFDPPFSPTVLGLLAVIPGGDALLQQIFAAVGVATLEEFLALPDLVKNIAMEGFLNAQLAAFGYSPLGLDDASLIQATGPDVAVVTFTFGWTSFEIHPRTKALVVKTYGIESYSEAELLADPAEVTARTPTLRNEFSVEAR